MYLKQKALGDYNFTSSSFTYMGGVRSEVAKKLQNSDWEMRSAFPFQPVLNDIVIFQAMRPKPGLNAIIFPFIFHCVDMIYIIYRY